MGIKLISRVGLLLAVACAFAAISAASASAALPELGRCLPVKPTEEGNKKTFKGKFKNKVCTKEASAGNGHFEWSPGPGEGKQFQDYGPKRSVLLETASGATISCATHVLTGEYTGATTLSASLALYECTETATKEPCESIDTAETPPSFTNGVILAQPLKGELGLVGTVKGKPVAGWDFKAASGPALLVFECAEIPNPEVPETPELPVSPPPLPELPVSPPTPELPKGTGELPVSPPELPVSPPELPELPVSPPETPPLPTPTGATLPGLGTKYVIEGSFIARVVEPKTSKMALEQVWQQGAVKGVNQPEKFEGGVPDTLTANILAGVTPSKEAIGYTTPPELISNHEELEIKTVP